MQFKSPPVPTIYKLIIAASRSIVAVLVMPRLLQDPDSCMKLEVPPRRRAPHQAGGTQNKPLAWPARQLPKAQTQHRILLLRQPSIRLPLRPALPLATLAAVFLFL